MTKACANQALALLLGVGITTYGHTAEAEDTRQVDVSRHVNVVMRGVPIRFELAPKTSLSGEDEPGRGRANTFLDELAAALAKSLAAVEFFEDFGRLTMEFELEREPLGSPSRVRRIRVVESVPRLDARVIEKVYVARVPTLPNFRRTCRLVLAISSREQ